MNVSVISRHSDLTTLSKRQLKRMKNVLTLPWKSLLKLDIKGYTLYWFLQNRM